MPVEIRVPEMGESVVEATVGRWLKREGETVTVGELLVSLETDKVNMDVAAPDSGVLERILRPEGETVKPEEALGVIGEAAAADGRAAGQGAAPSAGAALPSAEGEAQEEVRASPLAQRVADELHVNIADVPPTGPGGRVTREDVEAFAHASATPPASQAPTPAEPRVPSADPASPPVSPSISQPPSSVPRPPSSDGRETRQRLSRRRLTIARRLVEAQQTSAMLTTFNEIDMSAVMALRGRRRDAFKERHGVGLGYMSFFTRAAIGALKAFPPLNAEIQGEELVLKQYYDIGVAIGDAEGLVVPVLRDADRMTFAEIERAIVAFAQKVKERTLSLEDLRGGTFTITNGGVFGSLLSTPILNPPQVGILGMHKIQERPVAVQGEVAVRPMMYVALTYDHRIVDGREAVQFLVRLKELIEDPERLLLEG
jgi:2-oxoglutarate dehydrogenase E2 component (dihydrolipoamide succinyltransferase)